MNKKINLIQELKKYSNIKKELKNFCFKKYIDISEDEKEKMKFLISKIIKKKYIKSYFELGYYTYISFYKGKADVVKFEIGINYRQINLINIDKKTNGDVVSVDVKTLLNQTFNNNILTVKSSNKYVLELSDLLKKIIEKVEPKIKNFINQTGDDYKWYNNNYNICTDIENNITKNILLGIDGESIKNYLINQVFVEKEKINLEDYYLKCALNKSISYEKENEISLHFYFYNDDWKKDSFFLCNYNVDLEKSQIKLGNIFLENSKYIKEKIDFHKKTKDMLENNITNIIRIKTNLF